MGWAVNATSRPLYPKERPGAHYIPSACLDGSGKPRPHCDSIPLPSYSFHQLLETEPVYELASAGYCLCSIAKTRHLSRDAAADASPCAIVLQCSGTLCTIYSGAAVATDSLSPVSVIHGLPRPEKKIEN
jgi:hypothetical protein